MELSLTSAAQQLAPVNACGFGLFEATSDTDRKFTRKVCDVLCLFDGYLPFPGLFSHRFAVVSVGFRRVQHLANAARCGRSSRLTICPRIVGLLSAHSVGRRIILALPVTV
jgi:hypothetical protein